MSMNVERVCFSDFLLIFVHQKSPKRLLIRPPRDISNFNNLIMITHLQEIVDAARAGGRRRLAVAFGNDSHTLRAVYDAWLQGLVEPTIFGDKAAIIKICNSENIDPTAFAVVDEKSDVRCVELAVSLVAGGGADVLMKGLVSTDKYMRGILNTDAGLVPPKGTLSHVSVIEFPGAERLLCVSDVAVIPQPDFKQKQLLIKYLTRISQSLGVERPKIACIAPSEQVLPSVPSSTEAAILAKMADRGQLGNVIVDGPLSLDVALYADVAEEKKVKGSSVAGKADGLLFPNIESANVFFKSATHFGGAEIAAIVVGTRVPCVLTSRGDTPRTKLFSIALACLQTAVK